MILLGYPGEITTDTGPRLLWGTLSTIPFLYLLYVLFVELAKSLDRQPAEVRSTVGRLRIMLVGLWGVYPIAYLMPVLGFDGAGRLRPAAGRLLARRHPRQGGVRPGHLQDRPDEERLDDPAFDDHDAISGVDRQPGPRRRRASDPPRCRHGASPPCRHRLPSFPLPSAHASRSTPCPTGCSTSCSSPCPPCSCCAAGVRGARSARPPGLAASPCSGPRRGTSTWSAPASGPTTPTASLARVGSVPAEEYAFVVLLVVPSSPGGCAPAACPRRRAGRRHAAGSAGALAWVAVAAAGAGLVGGRRDLALPRAAARLGRAAAGAAARRGRATCCAPRLRDRAVLALPVALWLCVADRLALADGIWVIAPESSTGVLLLGLPLEEALFFLLTCLLVTDGLVLATDERALVRARLRASARRAVPRDRRRPGASGGGAVSARGPP